MTGLTLRDYHPGDWRAMHALDVQCFSQPFRFSARAMRRFAETPNAITLLAEADTELAAFCIAHLESSHPAATRRTAYIVTLDVAPPYRLQGLARRLMQQIETRAHTAGADQITLHVFSGNTAALQLYKALGYHRTGLAPNFYAPAQDALIYSKPLEPPQAVCRSPLTPAPPATPPPSAP